MRKIKQIVKMYKKVEKQIDIFEAYEQHINEIENDRKVGFEHIVKDCNMVLSPYNTIMFK